MQIRLLGSVEVERDGSSLKLGGPKQRAVLAMLALSGNAPARRALELWHGPPLSGMRDEPFASAEARRLEELYAAATEHALQGELEAGRHVEAIGRLASLVEEHPLRERPRALLMLALY